jgi:hypothetical protein
LTGNIVRQRSGLSASSGLGSLLARKAAMTPIRPEVVAQWPSRTWSQKRAVLNPSTRYTQPLRISAMYTGLTPPTWNIGRLAMIVSPSRRYP